MKTIKKRSKCGKLVYLVKFIFIIIINNNSNKNEIKLKFCQKQNTFASIKYNVI